MIKNAVLRFFLKELVALFNKFVIIKLKVNEIEQQFIQLLNSCFCFIYPLVTYLEY